MPESKGYYVKPCRRTSIPRVIIAVDAVTRPTDTTDQTAHSGSRSLSHVVTSHSFRNWTGWTPIQTIAHGSHHAFWEWLENVSWNQKRIYLFAPDAGNALTLLRFWERLEMHGVSRPSRSRSRVSAVHSNGITATYCLLNNIISQRTTIVDYLRDDRRYVWCSRSQYMQLSDREIADMVGVGGLDDPESSEKGTEGEASIPSPSVLTLRAMQYLANWWQQHKGGPWAPSIGSLAARFLRSRLPARTVCTHRHGAVLSLERAACFGGRVSCWYVGYVASRVTVGSMPTNRPHRANHAAIDGPVYSVDVRSMYPHLLATRPYPIKMIGYERNVPISDVRCLLDYLCVVARVSLDTDQAEYPYRSGNDVYYPTGQYVTVLCGDELRHALDMGYVRAISEAAYYQRGIPFAGAAAELLAARAVASDCGRIGEATCVKLLSNAITGKFAQRLTVWTGCPGKSAPLNEFGEPVRWGPWYTTRPDNDWKPSESGYVGSSGRDTEASRSRLITRYRSVAGMVERLDRCSTGTGTLQACYAYLTSYGRSLMRTIRSAMPAQSVILQDTDGLWITETGLTALTDVSVSFGSLPGELRIDKRISHARVYGPKHYWCDGVWVLSGMRDPSFDPQDGSYTYQMTSNPIRNTPTEAPSTIREYTRRCELLTIHLHGHQGDDGWISPYHLSEGVKVVAPEPR